MQQGWERIERKRLAYHFTFNADAKHVVVPPGFWARIKVFSRILFRSRRLAYELTFLNDEGRPHIHADIVLEDLRTFSKTQGGGIVISPVSRLVDPHATCYRAGLRDVYQRIQLYLNLSNPREVNDDEQSTSQ